MFSDNGISCSKYNKFKWFNSKIIIIIINDLRDIILIIDYDIKIVFNIKKNVKCYIDNNFIDNIIVNNSFIISYNINL